MNHDITNPRHPWARLTQAARQAPVDGDTAAPFGFATRVAALARDLRGASLLDRFALRAVGIASILAILSVAVNYPAVSAGIFGISGVALEDIDLLSPDDAVSIVLDLGD
ncbi:MAG: hypothetical protein WCQ89_00975 [Verrucomicrobiota bacterium]|jgi:hypothetical protein